MFMWFSVTETYWWSGWTSSSFVTYWCWHNFFVENILWFQYCLWLFTDVDIFFMCKIFLSFLTDVYVIFCYWNISMKCTHFIFICHWMMLTFFCGKYSRISIVFLIIYWCWLFFMWKMFLSFSTDVYVIFCYWNISMKCMHFMLICHLLMLTYFLCGKYSRISILVLIIYWCWQFFMCNMFLSFSTDVYVSFCYWNISMKCTHFILIWHFFLCAKCSYHSQLMLMWFSCSETYWWSVHTSSSFVIDWCWLFFVENILEFQYWFWLFTDVDYFSCGKCSYHSRLMFMWFSVTETYQWSARTSCWFVIYWCWHIFCVENILEFQYWFWLFTDVDYFSCAKCSYHSQLMFMWVPVTETYRWSACTSSWFVIY